MFSQVLNAVSDGVFKEDFLWRNNISFKKDTEKIVLLQVKGLIQIIVKLRAEKSLCTFLSSTKHPFEEHGMLRIKTIVCSNTLKRNEL